MAETTSTPRTPKYPRAEWFEKKIALHLLNEKNKSGRHNGLIRGSSLGLKCSRRLAYMVLGYQEGPATAHQQYVLGMGNAVHDMIQMWMANMGLVKATPFISKFNTIEWKGNAEGTIRDSTDGIIGHYDGLTEPLALDPNTYCAIDKKGVKYLLEFKTISNRSKVIAVFLKNTGTAKYPKLCTAKYIIEPGQSLMLSENLQKLPGSKFKPIDEKGNEYFHDLMTKENLPPGSLLDVYHQIGQFQSIAKPKDEHIYQATYYASRLKADKILIVYLAKDAGEGEYSTPSIMNIPIKAFEVPVSEEVIVKVSEKAQNLWQSIELKKELTDVVEKWLPDRKFTPDDFMSECTFCPYTYTCYPSNNTVKEQVERRMKEHKALGLPMITGEPFTTHDKTHWGLESIEKVNDQSGQKAT
jgi:hypothetical protein